MALMAHVMVILMGVLLSGLPLEADETNQCIKGPRMCPAGEYLSGCKCYKCAENFYTKYENRERQCHPCFKDCKPELHMQVVKPCTSASDVVCHCMTGFVCRGKDFLSGHCKVCEPDLQATTNSTINPLSITSANPQAPSQSHTDASQLWVLVVVPLGILINIIIITILFCRRRKKECLKQFVKRCSYGNQKEDHNTTSSVSKEIHTQERSSNTFNSSRSHSPTHQPSSTDQPLPPAGNLGPLHIYGAGTVFVSLLNQFGQNGGEKEEDEVRQEVLDMSAVPCPTSPPLPLSKEERSRDGCYVSFPSQEQGKECHMSKEEGL